MMLEITATFLQFLSTKYTGEYMMINKKEIVVQLQCRKQVS